MITKEFDRRIAKLEQRRPALVSEDKSVRDERVRLAIAAGIFPTSSDPQQAAAIAAARRADQ